MGQAYRARQSISSQRLLAQVDRQLLVQQRLQRAIEVVQHSPPFAVRVARAAAPYRDDSMLVNAMNARTTIAAARASNLRDIDDISVRRRASSMRADATRVPREPRANPGAKQRRTAALATPAGAHALASPAKCDASTTLPSF